MKKEIIIWIVIALLVSIVALDAFHCSRSRQYQVHWNGSRYLGIQTFGSTEGANLINGRVEKFTVHIFGPVSFWSRHD